MRITSVAPLAKPLCLLVVTVFMLPMAQASKAPAYIVDVLSGDDPVHGAMMLAYLEGYKDHWIASEQYAAYEKSEEAFQELTNALRACEAEGAFEMSNVINSLFSELEATEGRVNEPLAGSLELFWAYYIDVTCPSYRAVAQRQGR